MYSYSNSKPAFNSRQNPRIIRVVGNTGSQNLGRLPAKTRFTQYVPAKTIITQNVPQLGLNIQGFDKVFDPHINLYRRGIWICAIVAFYGLCIFQLSDRVKQYLAGPIILEHDMTTIASVEFPSVTVCPTKIVDFIGATICSHVPVFPYESYEDFLNRSKRCIFKQMNTTLKEVWDKFNILTHHVDATTGCAKQANSTTCNIHLPASSRPVATVWGTCLTVTPATTLSYRGSLTFMMLSKTGPGPETVFIPHAADFIPRHRANLYTESVRIGFQVNVGFHRSQLNYLNTKQNPCVPEREARSCETNCLQKYLDVMVNCRLPFMINSTLTECNSYYDVWLALYYTELAYSGHEGCNCPRKCEETKITFYSDNFKSRSVDQTIFKLRFPDNSMETETEKYSYTLPSLISDIGGNLGFCVGLCLFSFVEVIEFMVLKVVIWMKYLFCRFGKMSRK